MLLINQAENIFSEPLLCRGILSFWYNGPSRRQDILNRGTIAPPFVYQSTVTIDTSVLNFFQEADWYKAE